jgi:hypothetical protein
MSDSKTVNTCAINRNPLDTTCHRKNKSNEVCFSAFGGQKAALEAMQHLVKYGTEIREEFSDAVAVPGPDEVDFF